MNLSESEILTLHGSSIRLPSALYPLFSEFLHPEMQALYSPKEFVQGSEIVGISFNVKEPIEIANRVKMNGLKVTHHLDDEFYLYLPKEEVSKFRLKNVSAQIKYKLENQVLMLYYDASQKRRTVESVFT